ncbi:uncharacterized protein SPPG_05767 [Spizellomyces punctatus DAOM BR117]|uniref:Uncharacterized protein n=1 Tax=Spizellomyces punctatus (strain DAOM BR117) TaxID=645134 RepID=A0A0L0HB29_SPIPD|nr:uncharacterized protein SPPG_05767 [Spizellomyces punctatus DAOM BR117]KNC98790.1 hypothetical protein SPPG_05767 [Spizellomyces punctatus DAOM BR117]|eukprot:XP_016606830.1 hypothetical protein SPPG_05767 [Spizellomyces punctatus DAOM BR117]
MLRAPIEPIEEEEVYQPVSVLASKFARLSADDKTHAGVRPVTPDRPLYWSSSSSPVKSPLKASPGEDGGRLPGVNLRAEVPKSEECTVKNNSTSNDTFAKPSATVSPTTKESETNSEQPRRKVAEIIATLQEDADLAKTISNPVAPSAEKVVPASPQRDAANNPFLRTSEAHTTVPSSPTPSSPTPTSVPYRSRPFTATPKLKPPTPLHLAIPAPPHLRPFSTHSSCHTEDTPETPVSVKTLRNIWEKMARENGWTSFRGSFDPHNLSFLKDAHGGGWVTAVGGANETEQSEDKVETSDEAKDQKAAGEDTSLDTVEKSHTQLSQHNTCDMIVCGVKTLTINGTKVHEIDLRCHACSSCFVLRAAHECGDDDDTNDQRVSEDEQSREKSGEPASNHLKHREPGLEWLRDERADYINIIC